MRDLKAKRNVIEYDDPVAGVTHVLFYRLPTNDERVALAGAFVTRDGDETKLRDDVFTVYAEAGKGLVLGFEKGTFAVDGKAISSDEKDKDSRVDWRDVIFEGAPEIFHAVARLAYGSGQTRAGKWRKEGKPAPLAS